METTMARKPMKTGDTDLKERPEEDGRPAAIWQGADPPPAAAEPALRVSEADLGRIIGALGEVTRVLSATSAQLGQLAQGGAFAAPQAAQVNCFGDDPFSQAVPTTNPPLGTPMAVTVLAPANPRLRSAIVEPAPAAALYTPGTAGFRYWGTAETMARGVSYWSALLPAGTTWSTANPMRVTLVMPGQQLNANYSRPNGLRFYRFANGSMDIYSCESPDVVAHELGHAVLDALKPQLFNAASIEAAAFHEAFGDISAMLCALQLQPLRQRVLAETGGRLNITSRLSRVAEQLGWGIRQLSPTAVDRDCLRNTANRFFYRAPGTLPPSAPANLLSSAPHSFSRVFSGAILDVLARMLVRAGAPSEATLLGVSRDLGQLLVDAIHAAPVATAYYSQVASAMVQAEQVRFGGRYRTALTSAFVERGILSVASTMALADAPQARAVPVAMDMDMEMDGAGSPTTVALAAADSDDAYQRGFGETPELPQRAVALDGIDIVVHAPQPIRMREAMPAIVGVAADSASDEDQLTRLFVEGLIQRGEVALGAAPFRIADLESADPDKLTHAVVSENGRMVLKRSFFSCGCCTGALRCG
jgi:hypothetical protein